MRNTLLITALLFGLTTTAQEAQWTSIKDINPFIGTGGHGHTHPSAQAPFGMIQLGPNTRYEGWDGCGGYHYTDGAMYGFTCTHLSGTGVSDYGDLLLMLTLFFTDEGRGSYQILQRRPQNMRRQDTMLVFLTTELVSKQRLEIVQVS